MLELSQAQFSKVSALVHEISGLNLHEGKFSLVRSRLANRMRESALDDFDAYMARVRADRSGRELALLVDALTTNKTSFFREPRHFELLRQEILPDARRLRRPLRIWSAGCSSGEEPYTMAMVVLDELGGHTDAKILATDISARMLARAREAIYAEEALEDVPAHLRAPFFRRLAGEPARYSLAEPVRALVHFARLNLVAAWPMRRRFDLICCRNVMIYFDKATQQRLIERFFEMLVPGGWFFAGHSESFAGLDHGFRYIEPAAYRRPF